MQRDKVNRLTDESLQCTRRMVALSADSQDMGAKALQDLNRQGEKLDQIEQDMDQINADVRKTEGIINKMEKWCGICSLPWKKKNKFKEDKRIWKEADQNKAGRHNSQPKRVALRDNDAPAAQLDPPGAYVCRITDDAREDEMADNSNQVGSLVGNLRNIAIDMATELEKQNRQIDRISAKGESNESRITLANQRTERLL